MLIFAASGLLVLACNSASAALTPDRVHTADSRKTLSYVKDGLIVGGDRAIDEVTVKDIRRASNAGFERVVIDLEGTMNGEAAAVSRAPFYHVAVSPEERRVVFTLWGRPKLAFDSVKVQQAFKKSAIVDSVELLPRLDPETWTFVVSLKKGTPVEIFELGDPVRIIMDIKAVR